MGYNKSCVGGLYGCIGGIQSLIIVKIHRKTLKNTPSKTKGVETGWFFDAQDRIRIHNRPDFQLDLSPVDQTPEDTEVLPEHL